MMRAGKLIDHVVDDVTNEMQNYSLEQILGRQKRKNIHSLDFLQKLKM